MNGVITGLVGLPLEVSVCVWIAMGNMDEVKVMPHGERECQRRVPLPPPTADSIAEVRNLFAGTVPSQPRGSQFPVAVHKRQHPTAVQAVVLHQVNEIEFVPEV